MKENTSPLNENEVPKPDFDGQWKKLITQYSADFIQFFFPSKFVKTLDLKRSIENSTDDLQKLFPDFGKKGKLLPDKLLKVFEKEGSEGFVLFHVEVEKEGKTSVPARLFEYYIRLKELFPDAKITAIVIYIGQRVPRRHNIFQYEFGGTKLTYEFNTYIVKKQSEEQLVNSDNPFALAVLACLYIIKSKKDYTKLLDYKRKLARLCFDKAYPKWAIRDLLLFINFTIALPPENEVIYYHEIIPIMQKKQLLPAEINPFAAQMSTKMIWGKTLDELLEDYRLKLLSTSQEVEKKARLEAAKAKANEEKARLEAAKAKTNEEKARLEAAKAKANEEKAKIEANEKLIKSVWKLHLDGVITSSIANYMDLTEEEVLKITKKEGEKNKSK